MDGAAAYAFQPAPFHLAAVTLPAAINLSSPPAYPVEITLEGKTYRPEPLVFYATALRQAPHPPAARRFMNWLLSPEAQGILRQAGYGAAPTSTRALAWGSRGPRASARASGTRGKAALGPAPSNA